jgi:hypothetical protein
MADVFCCMYGCNFLEAVHGRQIVELSDEVFVQVILVTLVVSFLMKMLNL